MITPSRSAPGDLVALVSPSGPVGLPAVESVAAVYRSWGLNVRVGAHALERNGFLAGSDEQRLGDLNDALRDPMVRGVLCLRGGYGLQRIVDRVDFAAVREDPKLVMGFSDVTALHMALWTQAGLPTVHGPNAAQLDMPATAEAARLALMTGSPVRLEADAGEGTYGVRAPGAAEGILLGGNLTMLATSIGTGHDLRLDGAILLLEDVGESPYRIDRFLVQLRRAGWLAGIRGVAVGQFTDCGDVAPVLLEHLGALGVPVLGGLPVGHGPHQVAVGLGVPAILDVSAGTLTAQPVPHP